MYQKLAITSGKSPGKHGLLIIFGLAEITVTGKLSWGYKSYSESFAQPCRACSSPELSTLVSNKHAALS